jgi:glutathione S-transferase
MLTLFHSPTTRSFRIKWLLEELGLPYNQKTINFYNEERVSADYLEINPMASVPAMEDNGLVLTESGAIINYILNHYADRQFSYPDQSREATLVDEWMYWSEGLFAVHQRIYWDHCAPPPGCILNPVPTIGEEAKRQAIRYAAYLERALGDEGFAVGDNLSGADFMLCFPLFLANLGDWFDNLPKIRAYVGRICQRPAFQAAIADTLDALQKMATASPNVESFRTYEKGLWNS